MKLNNFKKKFIVYIFSNIHGSVLFVTMLVIGIILFLAITFSSLMVMELRFTNLIDSSLAAQYAAEVGIERGILHVKNNDFLGETATLANEASYIYTIEDKGDKAIIESTGTKDEVRRKFVIEVTKDVTKEPNKNNTYKPFWREVNP